MKVVTLEHLTRGIDPSIRVSGHPSIHPSVIRFFLLRFFLIQTNVSNEFNESSKGLLANVYDIRSGHLEILTRQLESEGHRYTQIAISIVIKATGSFVQNVGRCTHSINGTTILGYLTARPQSHLMQEVTCGSIGIPASI